MYKHKTPIYHEDCVAHLSITEDEYQLPEVWTPHNIGSHQPGQQGAVPVGVSLVLRGASVINMSGSVVVHVSVENLHGLVLVLAIGNQYQPQ